MSELVIFDTNHIKSINDCELDYYSKRLATCSSDSTVKIFDISLSKNPICVAEIKDHSSPVWKVCWSHPKFGSLLASCSYDKSVIIYKEVNVNKYEMIYLNNEHKSSVNYIEWSPHECGLHLACACSDGHISIISYYVNKDTNEGCWSKSSIKAHLNGATCLSWEKSYNFLSNNKNLNDSDLINSFKLVSGGYDNQVIIWVFDNNTKEFHKSFQMIDKPHNSAIKDVSWRPNINNSTNIIASCSEEKIVILWTEDISNNNWKNNQVIKLKHKIHKISWSPNGTILAIACTDENVYLYKENVYGLWEEICNLTDDNPLSNSVNLINDKDQDQTDLDQNAFPNNQENVPLTNCTEFNNEHNAAYMNEIGNVTNNISSNNINYSNKFTNANNPHQFNYQDNSSCNSFSQTNYVQNSSAFPQEVFNLNNSGQEVLAQNNSKQNNAISNNQAHNIPSTFQSNSYGQVPSSMIPINPNSNKYNNNINQQYSSQNYLMGQQKTSNTTVSSNLNNFKLGVPPPPPPPSTQSNAYVNPNFPSQQLLNSSLNVHQSGLQPPSIQPPSLQPPSLQPPSLQPPSLQPPSLQPPPLQPPASQSPIPLTTNSLTNNTSFPPPSQHSTTFAKESTSSVQHPPFTNSNLNKNNLTSSVYTSTNLPNPSNLTQSSQFQNSNFNHPNFVAHPPPPPFPQNTVNSINKNSNFSSFSPNVSQKNIPPPKPVLQPPKNINSSYSHINYQPPPPPPPNATNGNNLKPTNQFNYPNYGTTSQ